MAPRIRNIKVAAVTTMATAALLGGLTTLPAQAAPAEGRVLAAGSPTAVKDSYVVTLKKGTGLKAASSAGRDLVEEYGGTVKRTFRSALNGYSAELSATEAGRLAADPAIASVEQDQVFTADATQSGAPWGLDRSDQASLPLSGTYTYPDTAGSGVTAYVIDTGVRISHSQFGGRAVNGYDAVDGDSVAQDGNGHGTHVASTIAGSTYGIAKQARIVAVRVLNNAGSGTTAGVVAGIDWVTANHSGPSVANLSLGGGASTAIDTAVRNSISSGVTYAVAAGNSSANASSYSPARVTEAITVGATTSTDARASYSNYGSVLDIFAPGSSITAGWYTSDTATNTISGTSMATPHVAGAAAVYLAGHPSATPAQVASALTAGAVTGKVTGPGTGSPNRLLQIVP
ncbi:S8 family peptidase [Streptomyces europaeiscabiei]|uniref:S8 family peptidase n=1 Tax=Streptomyces europaeiscabiei TaxID=146819 RepID=A0ABU4NSV5_9ACTN|nr:S8 family peptidase [Streptomyces europaeiscabiei]MDX2524946.1 S8 family peptidase [Streptomyces europaeiscabiei]MDX3547827.1 S8 family peptidase [Streptomyces europaeiscabiei]MDX3557697.1 S8 family peptidase [Streptomyces europaeiscabiei]MDX3705464.1 S8 family peptidase [Streptomyces europaeiscabiei]MDX3711743.1 S8 family peptidase [Streptomyces europaeiscabiei]